MNTLTGKFAFRVDASLQMGTGHVMRCLTLANVLKRQGNECHFICREHPGHLIGHIRDQGFEVHVLPIEESTQLNTEARTGLAHAGWLGATQEQDAAGCSAILCQLGTHWLVVDHYALDACWELALKPHYQKLMVIDDLADRPHGCDLLLDQTFGRDAKDYASWTPEACTLLCGSRYSLLRPDFSALREYSLKRREQTQLQYLLITMGGVDKDNATGQILEALKATALPQACRISVVMGSTAPWLAEVRQLAAHMPWPTEVKVGISDMAQLMADSDLAIGAAGATTWERCCLGLPTIMLVLADNQRKIAECLEQANAVYVLHDTQYITDRLPDLLNRLAASTSLRTSMSQATSQIADGKGVARVIQHLELQSDCKGSETLSGSTDDPRGSRASTQLAQ